MNKVIVLLVVMLVAFGFMQFRYSKLNAQRLSHAAAQKTREADAKFERLDFSPAALDNELKHEADNACMAEASQYVALNLTPPQLEDFCRCLSVHVVSHVYPLVPEPCRTAGRLDFQDAACAPLDQKKPHLVADRTQLIAKECAGWARAGVPAGASPAPAPLQSQQGF